jgi:hypothetical protein
MAEEVRLWRVGPDRLLSELPRAGLDLEARLQEWIARDVSVLDPGLLVIGREVETDFGGYIDLLCVDEVGDLVVVELKRDRTPREITAQALDYASWVAELSNERIRAIADANLGQVGFAASFRKRFESDLPETLNGGHRMLIVGSQIDACSERIIKYLSDEHGVNINAATFQYFRGADGAEFLARVFLLPPAEVELHSRTKGSSKRRPNLTYEELALLADEAGVADLYRRAVASFEQTLQKHTTRSSIGFAGLFNGSRKTVISLLPGQSCREDGLRFQLYRNRLADFAGPAIADVESVIPTSRERWIYYAGAPPDYEGFQGFIRTGEEIDRLAAALGASARRQTSR